ncbi:MAG: rhodanese-like domain-containing protein, partial [Promethearchaeia archaeon]
MKLKKILILSLFTLFLFTIAIPMNVDINTTLATNDNNQQDDNRLKLSNPYTDITAEEAHNMIYNKTLYPDLLALDVRSQSEYDSGHICNATLIPHTEIVSRISELEPYKDTEIIVYCGSGIRSKLACEDLDSYDFTKVFNMLGGISAWNSEGYEVCIDDLAPPIWNVVPTDQLLEYSEAFIYDLDASDPSGIDEWWLNDTIYFDIDGNGVITNKSLVSIGEYWLEVNVNDTYGNTLTDTFKVTVQDTTSPSWVLPPSDKTMEFGGSFNYDLDASDPSGIDE